MQTIRHRLRSFTWVALFAMLGLAFAPTVSHALNAGTTSNPWTEICTTADARSASGTPALPGDVGHIEHCPLCALSAGALGLPPADAVPGVVPSRTSFDAEPSALAPRALRGWRVAQPRAPPLPS